MKKLFIIFFIVFVGGIVLLCSDNEKSVLVSTKQSEIKISSALTMMYETDAGSGEYQVSNDSHFLEDGYIFNDKLSKCENGGKLTWSEETNQVILEANRSDRCYVFFDKHNVVNFAEYIKSLYTSDGTNGIYLHDGSGTYGSQETGDGSYRFSGANPNNYVCFGTDENPCPYENLYRIIGVFDNQVKLIKHDILTEEIVGYVDYTYAKDGSLGICNAYNGNNAIVDYYYWSGSSSNNTTWDNSTLNKIALNTTYYNSFSPNWQEMIANHNWQIGGGTFDNISKNIPKVSYSYELGNNSTKKYYSAKIGLMYVSDYGYAASPEAWNTILYNYHLSDIKKNNWLYLGTSELLITPRTSSTIYYNFSVYGDEGCNGDPPGYIQGFSSGVIRPTFYLNEDVKVSDGIGTIENPYRLVM